jgi:Ca2+-binding EF-hand superfamily protein
MESASPITLACYRCQENFEPDSVKTKPGDSFTAEKLCDECDSFIRSLKSQRKISWCENTLKGFQWLETSGALSYMYQYNQPISFYLAMKISAYDEKALNRILEGESDPETFSGDLRLCLQVVKRPSFRMDLYKLTRGYCAKRQSFCYSHELTTVCAWLLLFLDLNSAMWMLSFLTEKVLLPDFYSGSRNGNSFNGAFVETYVVGELIKTFMPSVQHGCLSVEELTVQFNFRPLVQLYIEVLKFEDTEFVWENIASEGSIAIVKTAVSLMMLSEQEIITGVHPSEIQKMLYYRNFTSELKEVYYKARLIIDECFVETLRASAKEKRARAWTDRSYSKNLDLQTCSHFTLNEIKSIQQLFQDIIKKKESRTKRAPRRANTVDIGMQYEGLNDTGKIAGITKSEFVKVVADFNENLKYSSGVLFEQFDEDKNDCLDFRELTLCISVFLKGTFEEKLKVCFDAYDLDKSGYLQMNEMQNMINHLMMQYREKYKEKSADGQTLEEIAKKLKSLEEKNEGILCFEEFYITIKSDQILFKCFSDHLGCNEENNHISVARFQRRLSRNPVAINRCSSCCIQ